MPVAEIKTGEQTTIDVTIRTDDLPHTRYYLQQDPEQPELPFRVLAFAPIDTVHIGGGIEEIHAKMLITSFDSTLVTIPPLVVESPSGMEMSQPLALKVTQPPVNTSRPEDIEDIKAPWDEPYSLRDILLLIFASPLTYVVLILILAYILYRRYKRRLAERPEPKIEVVIPERTPAERALQAIAELDIASYISQGEYQALYTQLVDILRRYIVETRGWHVMEMTSSELMRLLSEQKLPLVLREIISSILSEADLAKFARYHCSQEQAERCRRAAQEFISLHEELLSITPEPNKSESKP